MSFVYSQSTGILTHEGIALGKGYSGHGDGINNAAMQSVHDIGPIPRGKYRIGPQQTHPKLGPVAMPLQPYPMNEMFGRSAFFIHGPHSNDKCDSSEGCIILDRKVRVEISTAQNLGDDTLQVV